MCDKQTLCKIEPLIYHLYKTDLIEKYQAKTVRFYLSVLCQWAELADDVLAPSKTSITEWIKQSRFKISPRTYNSRLSVLRNFYKWAYRRNLVLNNVAAKLPKNLRVEKKLPEYLEDEEIGIILAAPDLSTFNGFRDHVMMRLIYETGISAAEIINLSVWSVNFAKSFLIVINPRNRKKREIPISKTMCKMLNTWKKLRNRSKPGKQYYLFIKQNGHYFREPHAIWKIVSRYSERSINISKLYNKLAKTLDRHPTPPLWPHVYPTKLRNSFAVHLLRNGCDLRAVQVMLGHESINQTAKFLELDIEMLKREHSKLFKS